MSMVKVVSPSGWDWDRPVALPLKLTGRGLRGNDRREFLKYASHVFLPYIDQIKVAKDEVPVHLIALGASEAYGPNRNGDAFKEAACKQYHETFVKFAKWYRNHKNKAHQGDPFYGYIKQSAYNDAMRRVELIAMLNAEKSAADRNGGFVADQELEKLAKDEDIPVSMACALPGTLVKTARGFTAVENIKRGDRVLTHRGRYRRVYATLRRTKQQYARVHTRYCGRQVLEFTPDHEFFVGRWQDIPASRTRNGLRSADPTGFSKTFRRKYRNQLHAHARWVACGDLRPGDLLLMPICRGSGKSDLMPETARVMGYYTAEGSVTADGYPCFTCNKEDRAVVELGEWADSIRRTYSEHEHSASDKAVNLTVYSKPYGSLMAGEVGRGVRNKVVPQTVYDASADVKLEYMAGWFNGDGWQDDKGLHWSTCSRSLSIELQMLLASVGIPASVYRIDHTSDLPDRPRTGDGTEYTVNVSNRYSPTFAGRSKAEAVPTGAEKTTVFITGDYLAVPVAAVEVVEAEVTVHDISVEADESFTAFGVAVHNCRVPYDECAHCYNKARTRDEYCKAASCPAGGCYDNLTRLVKVAGDTRMVYVNNDHPTWFDMSKVWRPADRIAYGVRADYLTKAAADGGVFAGGGAKAAEDLGLVAPLAILLASDLLIPGQYHAAVGEQVKLAQGLALQEERIGSFNITPEAKRAFAADVQGGIDLAPVGDPGTAKCAEYLAALADETIILPLRDFARLTKQADHVAGAVPALTGVYGRMVADGSVERLVAANPFAVYGKTPGAAARTFAARHKTAFSLEKEAVDWRCSLSAVRGRPVPAANIAIWTEKQAADAPEAEELARSYALYKLAALHRVAARGGDLLTTCLLSAVQGTVA
jgi:intein/homing endonuclease